MKLIILYFVFCIIININFVICESKTHFFSLSDIHYDQAYIPDKSQTTFCRSDPLGLINPSTFDINHDSRMDVILSALNGIYGRYGCDTNSLLLNATINSMKIVAQNNDSPTILINGDVSAHDAPSDTVVLSQIEYVLQQLRLQNNFKSSQIVFALGNNDVFPHYYLEKDGSWLKTLGKVLKKYRVLDSSSLKTFEKGGYFSVVSEMDPNLLIVSINTLWYSKKLSPSIHGDPDPLDQFAWLRLTLNTDKKVIIIGHIPPGFNDFNFAEQLYHDDYTRTLLEILDSADNIILSSFGHLHTDEFRIASKNGILLTPSISTSNDNNPGFRYYKMENESIVDYEEYFLDLVKANSFQDSDKFNLEYTFSKAWGNNNVTSIDLNLLSNIVDTISNDGNSFSQYWKFRVTGYTVPIYKVACVLSNVSEAGYKKCLESVITKY